MKITDIKWETDGEEVDLPTEVEVPDSLNEDAIADHLSDNYGWLVDSFSMPMTDNDRDYFGEFVNQVEGKVS